MYLSFTYRNFKETVEHVSIKFVDLQWIVDGIEKEPKLILRGLDYVLNIRTFRVSNIVSFGDLPTVKPKLVIVEGAKGVGKSTTTNALRETIPYAQLIRLSGVSDKTVKGREKVFNVHLRALEFALECKDDNTHLIFDRSYFSEKVFCSLMSKPYDFVEETLRLTQVINFLGIWYDITWILLRCDRETFESGLERGKADDKLVNSNVDSSMLQQDLYITELERMNINYSIVYSKEHLDTVATIISLI